MMSLCRTLSYLQSLCHTCFPHANLATHPRASCQPIEWRVSEYRGIVTGRLAADWQTGKAQRSQSSSYLPISNPFAGEAQGLTRRRSGRSLAPLPGLGRVLDVRLPSNPTRFPIAQHMQDIPLETRMGMAKSIMTSSFGYVCMPV